MTENVLDQVAPAEETQEQEVQDTKETPAEETQEQEVQDTKETPAEEQEPEQTEEPEPAKKESKSVPIKRFNKVYAQKKELERRLAEVTNKPQHQDLPIPEDLASASKPNPDDFEDYNEYVDKLTDWKLAQTVKGINTQAQKQSAEQIKAQQFQKIEVEVRNQLQVDPNFINNAFIPNGIEDLVADSDQIVDLAYFFGENKDLALQLANVPKHVALKTDAPAPTNPVSGSVAVRKDPEKMTMAEYEQYWLEQRKRG